MEQKATGTKWTAIVWAAAPLFFVIVGIAYFAEGLRAIPEGLVAWGTIVLAFTTYLLGKAGREQTDKLIGENRRVREEEIVKESLRRRLSEVEQWARQGIRCAVLVSKTNLDMQRYEALAEINVIRSISENVIAVANTVDKELSHIVSNASAMMNELPSRTPDWEELEQRFQEILDAIGRLKLKSSL